MSFSSQSRDGAKGSAALRRCPLQLRAVGCDQIQPIAVDSARVWPVNRSEAADEYGRGAVPCNLELAPEVQRLRVRHRVGPGLLTGCHLPSTHTPNLRLRGLR